MCRLVVRARLENRVSVRRFIGIAIVAICIGGPIAETFDRWDNTLTDGNDTEANLMIVALCVGLAIATERLIVSACVAAPLASSEVRVSRSLRDPLAIAGASPVLTPSPPLALRI
jgi:hypothetical protein